MYSVRYGLYDNHIPISADIRESPVLWCHLNRTSYLQKHSADLENFSLCFVLVLPSPLPMPCPLSSACHIFRNIWWLVSSLMFKQKTDSPSTNYCFSGLNLKHSHLPLFDIHFLSRRHCFLSWHACVVTGTLGIFHTQEQFLMALLYESREHLNKVKTDECLNL